MAHGKRAEQQGHAHYEYGSRRWYEYATRGRTVKTLTHRRERAAARRLEYAARHGLGEFDELDCRSQAVFE